jgi:SET domain-containing protein
MLQMSRDRVIDATRIGGRMRFINHSCEPNCGFEKWVVRGEERCGVFAIRRVQPGDELTLDYGFQYVHCSVRSSLFDAVFLCV